MTLLPTDSWQVIARPDLPAYELNTVDPVTGKPACEDHHIWRRSFGKDFREAWWVELEDGTILPNRVALSNETHRDVTENRSRIYWHPEYRIFHYIVTDSDELIPLRFQPGPQGAVVGRAAVGTPDSDHGAMQQAIDGREVPWDQTHTHANVEQCSRCKGTGKVEKKEPKSEHEQAPARQRVTVSMRVPKDERENGAQLLDEIIEACGALLVEAGMLQSTKGAAYNTVMLIGAHFLSTFNAEAEKTS